MAGEQYSTINKDTRALVADTIKMVQALQKGQQPAINDTKQYNNGAQGRRPRLLTPVIVTKANAKEAYANDPTLLAIVNAGGWGPAQQQKGPFPTGRGPFAGLGMRVGGRAGQ